MQFCSVAAQYFLHGSQTHLGAADAAIDNILRHQRPVGKRKSDIPVWHCRNGGAITPQLPADRRPGAGRDAAASCQPVEQAEPQQCPL